jgi:protein-serine/threonine kinase
VARECVADRIAITGNQSSSNPAAPQSLRRLFHDESSDAPDPFKAYGQQQGSFSSVSSSRTANQGDVESDGDYDPRTIKRTDFGASRNSPVKSASYRDVRDSKGLQPISIPLASSFSLGAQGSAKDAYDSAESSQQATPMPGIASSPTATRRLPRKGSIDSVALDSPRHAPGQRRPSTSATVRDDFGGSSGGGLRAFRSDANASSSSLSLGLEPPNRPFAPPRAGAPSLHRLHSAAPTVPLPAESPPRNIPGGLHPRPAMMRQASVAAVMERTEPNPLSPSAPGPSGRTTPMLAAGISMMRTRSGSRTDGEQSGLLPIRGGGLGLKEVLKVSIAISLSSIR